MKWAFILLLLSLVAPINGAQAEPPQLDTSGYGGVFFFPEKGQRPKDDRFKVRAGEEVSVCIKLSSRKSEILQEVKNQATGFQLILEDNKDPPNSIVVEDSGEDSRLSEGTRGCYITEFEIPVQTAPGIYQVANFLIRLQNDSFYSIREYLYEFSHADELEVENPSKDLEPPKLVMISSLEPKVKKIKKRSTLASIKIKQSFRFEEEASGIDRKSLRVFYRLYEEGRVKGVFEAKCKNIWGWDNRFRCRLVLRRPNLQWALRDLSLELESIYIKDKAGNLLSIPEPKNTPEVDKVGPLRFEFIDKKKIIRLEPITEPEVEKENDLEPSPKNQEPGGGEGSAKEV